jgi:two-component system cell cycle response regulator
MSLDLMELPQLAADPPDESPLVLIVDDDQSMAEVLACRLRRQGMETLVATTGSQGLDRARTERPSLIVLDLCLPDADGLRICQQLADATETCAIPVIIVTGVDQPEIVRQCRLAGCQYFLHKPYDPKVLLVLIRQALADQAEYS